MHISLVGFNLLDQPVLLREKLAISSSKLPDGFSVLKKLASCGVILSTCNRVEVYTSGNNIHRAREIGLAFFKHRLESNDSTLPCGSYAMEDSEAVLHLFRVASSLESVIVGECEILGQIKNALQVAQKFGMVNFALGYIFQNAIRIGRLVRAKTSISKNALSVSSLALDLAENVSGDLETSKLLIIGAGEAGRLVAKIALSRGILKLVIANRTFKRAKALSAKVGGIPVAHDGVVDHMMDTNILITCSGAPHRTLDAERVRKVMNTRPQVPLVIIDIGVPRNVDPEVGLVENVSLYSIDDLLKLSESNRVQREDQVYEAEQILKDEMGKFLLRWRSFVARPMVKAIVDKADKIRELQLKRTFHKLTDLTVDEQIELEAMTKSIVAKLLHAPITFLKANSANGSSEIVKDLFQLDNNQK
jgi:glutamyl-tRNA reductase